MRAAIVGVIAGHGRDEVTQSGLQVLSGVHDLLQMKLKRVVPAQPIHSFRTWKSVQSQEWTCSQTKMQQKLQTYCRHYLYIPFHDDSNTDGEADTSTC
jgi:hypothetical protein